MVTGMGMWFQNGSEMGMKFEVIGSWKGKNVTKMWKGMLVLTALPLRVLAIGPTVALIPGGAIAPPQ